MRILKMSPNSLLLGKGRKSKKGKGPESSEVKARASAQISVQWHSCQNQQGISAKSGFLSSVRRGQEKLNCHFFWPVTGTRMALSTTVARTETSGLLISMILRTLGTGN